MRDELLKSLSTSALMMPALPTAAMAGRSGICAGDGAGHTRTICRKPEFEYG